MPPLPSPSPHILEMGNDILRDLDNQQQKIDGLFADGWPKSFLAAECTSRQPRMSHSPGDSLPLLPQLPPPLRHCADADADAAAAAAGRWPLAAVPLPTVPLLCELLPLPLPPLPLPPLLLLLLLPGCSCRCNQRR